MLPPLLRNANSVPIWLPLPGQIREHESAHGLSPDSFSLPTTSGMQSLSFTDAVHDSMDCLDDDRFGDVWCDAGLSLVRHPTISVPVHNRFAVLATPPLVNLNGAQTSPRVPNLVPLEKIPPVRPRRSINPPRKGFLHRWEKRPNSADAVDPGATLATTAPSPPSDTGTCEAVMADIASKCSVIAAAVLALAQRAKCSTDPLSSSHSPRSVSIGSEGSEANIHDSWEDCADLGSGLDPNGHFEWNMEFLRQLRHPSRECWAEILRRVDEYVNSDTSSDPRDQLLVDLDLSRQLDSKSGIRWPARSCLQCPADIVSDDSGTTASDSDLLPSSPQEVDDPLYSSHFPRSVDIGSEESEANIPDSWEDCADFGSGLDPNGNLDWDIEVLRQLRSPTRECWAELLRRVDEYVDSDTYSDPSGKLEVDLDFSRQLDLQSKNRLSARSCLQYPVDNASDDSGTTLPDSCEVWSDSDSGLPSSSTQEVDLNFWGLLRQCSGQRWADLSSA